MISTSTTLIISCGGGCCCSVAQSYLTLRDSMHDSMSGLPVLHHLLEFAQTHGHWVGDTTEPSHPLSPLLLMTSIFLIIRIFSNESALCIWWPKYQSFSFSISPSNGYPGLISFRMDWFDLLAVPGTLMSLLQHHSSKASILLFFMVQLSHPYTTTGKTIALLICTSVGTVILCLTLIQRLMNLC